jgi:hypothetical protein
MSSRPGGSATLYSRPLTPKPMPRVTGYPRQYG